MTLSLTGTPGGARTTFSPNPVASDGTSALTIRNLNRAATSGYDMTLTYAGGSFERNKALNLTLLGDTPAASSILLPPDGATDVSVQLIISLTSVNGAESDQIQIALNGNFANTAVDTTVTGTHLPMSNTLATSSNYSVRGSRPKHVRRCALVHSLNLLHSEPLLQRPKSAGPR